MRSDEFNPKEISCENGRSCVVHDLCGKNPCCVSCIKCVQWPSISSRICLSKILETMLVEEIGR